VSTGGTGVTAATVTMIAETFDCVAKRAYGSTEAPTVTTAWAGDPFERGRDTDGRATGDVELRVVDSGELWVRGPEVCRGYASADDTARSFSDDGWYRTGDLATIDGEGWLTITGRISDVIIRGGENIAAGEVESVLEAHPAVREAVAVPFPDDRLGERVCAFVVLDARAGAAFDLDASRAWFESRGVTPFKWPERIEVVDALPLLPAGKPDRNALKKRAARRA
jgi:acyl-CoA synthetase (AMP-forming)/AMP-acid ligase II